MALPLYVFDLDHTLIDGDSSTLWSEYLVRHGIIRQPGYLQQERQLMQRYAQGKMDIQQYIAFTLAPLAQIPIEEVNALVQECIAKDILPRLYPQAQTLIRTLRQQERQMLIISASISFLVTAMASRLGIEDAIGVEVKVQHHRYSSIIDGIASYQQGKIVRLQQWITQHPEYGGTLTFYTDSINDLPLCQYADRVYLVNPCPQLAEQGEHHRWPTLSWYRE